MFILKKTCRVIKHVKLQNIRNYTSKVIHKLVNTEGGGGEFTSTADILKCQTEFYKDLYNKVDSKDKVSIQLVLGDNDKKLSDKESQDLEGEILYSELAFALKNMKKTTIKVQVWTDSLWSFLNSFGSTLVIIS